MSTGGTFPPAQISRYLKAGISSMSEMERLADAGITGYNALSYAECGLSTEDMFTLADSGIAGWVFNVIIECGVTDLNQMMRAAKEMKQHNMAVTEWANVRKFVTQSFEPEFSSRLFIAHTAPRFTARACSNNTFSKELLTHLTDHDFNVVVYLVEETHDTPTSGDLRSLINFVRTDK